MGALLQPPGFCLPPPLSVSLFKPQREHRSAKRAPTMASPHFSITTEADSRKGVSWSESEHLAFLAGLQAFGKGQWKQISRYYVPSRTPTQVASHAQKHFLRLGGASKRRSRFDAAGHAATPAAPQQQGGAHAPHPPLAPAPGPSRPAPSSAASAAPSFVLGSGGAPPAVAADGTALGIPVVRAAPTLPPVEGGKIPMLRVLPGRITAVMTYAYADGKPRSPAPSQQPAPRRPPPADVPAATRRAHMQQLQGLRDRLRGASPDASPGASSGSSGAHSALDALAGVAAALAEAE